MARRADAEIQFLHVGHRLWPSRMEPWPLQGRERAHVRLLQDRRGEREPAALPAHPGLRHGHAHRAGSEYERRWHPGATCGRRVRAAWPQRRFRSRAMIELEERLAKYLRVKLGASDLTVANLARIPGGASRETYRFRARYNGRDRGLILRRDPVASLIETERATEYRAYEAFHRLGL